MRFSSAFSKPTSDRPEAHGEQPAREKPRPAAPAKNELPDDLDARVRLVGEWQLGED